MSRHDVATVIPVAPPDQAKQRLGGVLGPDDRADLARRMLLRTIEAALEVGPVVVVSRSPEVLESARAAGATGLLEVGTTLDGAVDQGLARVAQEATAAIVVPADLPLVTGDALADLLAVAGSHEQVVVVAPCQRRDGTNGMVLRPPTIIGPRYGPGSAARHLAAGRATGAQVVEVTDPRFVDLDTPEDWARFGPALLPDHPRP